MIGVPILGPKGGVREKNNQMKGKTMGAIGKPNSTRPGGNNNGVIVRNPPLEYLNHNMKILAILLLLSYRFTSRYHRSTFGVWMRGTTTLLSLYNLF